MGRYLLFIVAAVGLVGTVLSLNMMESETASASRRAESQEATLAREAAESGFSITKAQLVQQFAAQAPVRSVSLDGGRFGTYDAAVNASGLGPLDMRLTGRFDGARHQIVAQAMPLLRLGGALVIAAEAVTYQSGSTLYTIRGIDHRQPGALVSGSPTRAGAGRTAHAVLASSASIQSTILGSLPEAGRPLLSGIATSADVGVAPLAPVVVEMYEQALAVGQRFSGNQSFSNRTFGSPGTPAVLVVAGNAELRGTTTGYGLLVVQGDFKIKDTARWEGIVLVQADSDERLKVTAEHDGTVVGSLLLVGIEDRYDDGDTGLPGGHFDVDVFTRNGTSMRRNYHKHQYDDSYDVTHVDLIGGPGVGAHWSAFRSVYAGRPIRVELFNTHNGSGTLTLASPAGSYSVPNCSAFSTTIIPDQVTAFRTSFVDLRQLRGTSPGSVSGDAANRRGSYSIRLYDGATLVYEVSAYEHTSDRDGYGCAAGPGPGGTGGTSSGPDLGDYGRFEIIMKDRAQLLYSEEAAGQGGFVLSTVRAYWRIGHVVLSSGRP